MKRRNLILAFALIGLFLLAGRWYFRVYVRQKPFGIVLFVADGLTTSRLAVTRQFAAGADGRLTLDYFSRVALLRGGAADYSAGDPASSATAIATGLRANLRAVGVDPEGRDPRSLVDLARAQGRSVGLVTNGSLTGGAAAAFYAKAKDAGQTEEIAKQLADQRKFNVVLGGGGGDFRGAMKGGRRNDGRDLGLELQNSGYVLAKSLADLDAAAPWQLPRVFGLLGDEAVPENVELAELVKRAIQYLEKGPGGYLLVVDVSQIETAARANDAERVLRQTVELDRAVAAAWNYAGPKAFLVVAGLQETGGLAMNGYPLRSDRSVALLGTNPTSNLPAFTWASGPNGRSPGQALKPDPAATFASNAVATVSDALVLAEGEAAESVHGVLEATELFEILKREL
ncbi:MAG: alkaline phosphatase [Verrucomicrobia bacterium]|nr:alkaline phosphatase [Verrucomicrobiota bacterium]